MYAEVEKTTYLGRNRTDKGANFGHYFAEGTACAILLIEGFLRVLYNLGYVFQNEEYMLIDECRESVPHGRRLCCSAGHRFFDLHNAVHRLHTYEQLQQQRKSDTLPLERLHCPHLPC